MASTEGSPSRGTAQELSGRFEELRAAYHARLTSDRARLMTLRAGFDAAAAGNSAAYEALHRVAHGMAGAAAVFEAGAVALAARRLETAALAGARAPGDGAAAAAREALDALIDLLLTVSL